MLFRSSPIDPNVKLLQILEDKKMIITFQEKDLNEVDSIYHCGNSRQYCYLDCFEVDKALITVSKNIEFKVNSTSDLTKHGNRSFLIDLMSYESKFRTQNDVPGCQNVNQKQADENEIYKSMRNWMQYVSNESFDPFWVRNCEEEINKPFNVKDPKLYITVPYLNNRAGLRYGNLEIFTHHQKIVHRGRIKNGKHEHKMYIPSGTFLHLIGCNRI